VTGPDVRAEFVVAGGPDGEVAFHAEFADGRLVSSSPGADPDADVSLALSYELALGALDGDVDLNAAYMRGDVKTTGHGGRLLDLLSLLQSESGRGALAALQIS
jgi:hypothetical protein